MSRDYEIGYGKPPKHTQFKPGQSGNLKGRPKLYQSTISVLSEPVPMVVQGKKTKVSSVEAGIRKTAQNAIEGHLQAIKRFLKLCDEFHLINEFDDFRPGGPVRVPSVWQPNMTIEDIARQQHLERKKNMPKRQLSEKERIVRKVALERHHVPELGRKHTILDLVLLTLRKRALKDRHDVALALFLELETRCLPDMDTPRAKYLILPPEDLVKPGMFKVEDVEDEPARIR